MTLVETRVGEFVEEVGPTFGIYRELGVQVVDVGQQFGTDLLRGMVAKLLAQAPAGKSQRQNDQGREAEQQP